MTYELGVILVLAGGFFAGAFLGHRLNVPSGVLVGTIVGVGCGLALLGFPEMTPPSWVNQLLQILVGLLVGLGISRGSLRSGVRSLLPALLLATVMISTGVLSALVSVRLTSIDIGTALFAAAPGGITEMSSIGTSLGADGAAVAAIHLVRILLAIGIANILSRRLYRFDAAYPAAVDEERDSVARKDRDLYASLGLLALAGLVGAALGVLGVVIQAPAGGVIGAFVGSAAVMVWQGGSVPVGGIRFGTQALSGGIIGLGISSDFFGKLVDLAGAGAIIISIQMLLWFAIYQLLVKLCRYDGVTAIFSSAPGGMKELVPGSAQAGADMVTVTFTHLVRKIATITVLPTVIVWLFIQ